MKRNQLWKERLDIRTFMRNGQSLRRKATLGMRHLMGATETSSLSGPSTGQKTGWGSFGHTCCRGLFSSISTTVLPPYLYFHISSISLSFVAHFYISLFFSHPVTLGDTATDRVSLKVLGLAFGVQQVSITMLTWCFCAGIHPLFTQLILFTHCPAVHFLDGRGKFPMSYVLTHLLLGHFLQKRFSG